MSERIAQLLAEVGGVAGRRLLVAEVGARALDAAVAAGDVERVGRGRYALPGLGLARHAAVRLGGVVSHTSAALQHGWGVRREPGRADVIVPPGRKLPRSGRKGAVLRWRQLPEDDVLDGVVTGPLRTVVDCARDLPVPDALAVADSALRVGAVTERELRESVATLPRTGRARAELVLRQATPQAAGPFESSLRGLAIEAVGPAFVPQAEVRLSGGQVLHPDLVCEELRIVAEADSAEHHTTRHQIRHDCWRYDELVLDDWLVLRFAWEHAMRSDEWTRGVFSRAVERQRRLLGRGSVFPSTEVRRRGLAGPSLDPGQRPAQA